MGRPILIAAVFSSAFVTAIADLRAQTIVLEPLIVTATRSPSTVSELPFSVRILDSEKLANIPALTLDGALRSVPGFSLFRRSDSLTAHPTAQGVSLRGLGPSGASRTLVLLDGVPVNDPFGGWVAWSKLPRESLDRVEIVQGGGATAWGNAALGGVVHLISKNLVPGSASARLTAGAFSQASVEGVIAQGSLSGVLEISGRSFRTDGFGTIAPESRGPVDIPASQRHRWLSARLRSILGSDTEMIVTGRVFSERRGNGTPLQKNRSREAFGSVAINHHPVDGVRWNAIVFAQDQEFSSTFSSVNAARSAETPTNDQFSVPATAWGLSLVATLDSPMDAITTTGIDIRAVSGETGEDSGYSNGMFTRRRIAGGNQQTGGLFIAHSRKFSESVRFTGGVRADHWADTGGFRRESIITTGYATRLDNHADLSGWEFSPNAGLVWGAAPGIRTRFAAQRSFRRPTLNELHRPFRVGAFITEANPSLRTETVNTLEAGADWTRGKLTVSATTFRHDMRDAVANITLIHGPGTFPDFGFVPAGGAGRRRLNMDKVVVKGFEFSTSVEIGARVRVTAEYLYSDARVRRGNPNSSLDGKRIPQVPRHSATLAFQWTGPAGLVVSPRVRMFSQQFEDDENRLSLSGAAVADISVSWRTLGSSEFFIMMENISDARVETGISLTGVVNIGTPRMAVAGFRGNW